MAVECHNSVLQWAEGFGRLGAFEDQFCWKTANSSGRLGEVGDKGPHSIYVRSYIMQTAWNTTV